jgi:hypothetical protein
MASIHKKNVAIVKDLANRVQLRLGTALTVTTGFDATGNPTMSVGPLTTGTQSAFVRFIEFPSLGVNAVGNAQDSYGPNIAQIALECQSLGVAVGGAITAATWANNVATITTTSAHGLSTGMEVAVAGVSVAGYNGTYGPITVLSTTQYSYPITGSSLASSSAGTTTQVVALMDNYNQLILLGEIHMTMVRLDLWLSANGTAPSVSTFSASAANTSGGPMASYDSDVRFPLIGNM